MGDMTILQIAVLGIITVFMAIQFKNTKSEYAMLILIVTSLLMFGFGVSKLGQVIHSIENVKNQFGIAAEYMEILVKIVGISYICEFSSDICKDNGFGTLANQIQIFGKLSILVIGLPVFMQLFDSISILV